MMGSPEAGDKNVVGRHHEGPSFELGLNGQGYVDGHLVTIKVCVVSRTHQGDAAEWPYPQ